MERNKHLSTGEPIYWPSDRNKLPDLVGFCVTKGIPQGFAVAKSCFCNVQIHYMGEFWWLTLFGKLNCYIGLWIHGKLLVDRRTQANSNITCYLVTKNVKWLQLGTYPNEEGNNGPPKKVSDKSTAEELGTYCRKRSKWPEVEVWTS
jgi:hypothetical protein